MIITLASTSAVKISAVNKVIKKNNVLGSLVTVKVPSGVPEQPVGDQTVQGAIYRAEEAAKIVSQSHIILSIESGIFQKKCLFWVWYVDIAVVIARISEGVYIVVQSDAVPLPKKAVLEALKRGDPWTVGKVLAEWGMVAQHDDPHLSLTGKSRSVYVEEAVARLFLILCKRKLLSTIE